MPRAFDRGIPDVDKSPLRNATDYSDPEGFIGQGATEAANVLGNVFRQFLALDQIEAAFTEFAESFIEIDWLSPQAVRDAIAAAGKLLAEIGRWILQLLKNFTRLDLTENSDFVRDLFNLLAFDVLYAAWETFSTGWSALNWSNPLAAIHPAWMLFVDFGWAIGGWISQLLSNILGINFPGWLALDDLRGHWTTFFTAWESINWANPLTAIHTAWMATVDLIGNLLSWAQTVLRNLTGIELPGFFEFGVLKAAWQAFTAAWSAISWTSLAAIWDALKAIGTLLRGVVHWAIGVFQNLTGIDLEAIAESFGLDALVAAITTWADTIASINWLADPIGGLMTAIGATIKLAQDLGNWLLGVIDSWLGWAGSVVHDMFTSFDSFVGTVIEYFFGADARALWVGALEAIGGVGASIAGAISGFYNGAVQFFGLIGDFLNLGGFLDFVEGILGEDGLLGLLVRIPFIGPLVSAITGITPDEGTALDLTTLVTWARGLLTGNSPIPGGNIVGQISEAILSVIPVANISALSPNLLSQGNFNNNLTVSEGGGWSWDGTTTATGTGGSAKLVATGAAQELFSRQAVKVNAGDRVDVSCKVRTSGFTAGAGRSMVLSIIPWTMFGGAMIQQPTITVATRTTSATSWADMTGTTWTVPANVVRLTVRLAVTANSGAVVWFDDAKVSKTGELGQNLVESLITAWNQLIGGLTNPVAGAAATTGKTWQDLFGGASAFRSVYNVEESRGQTLRLNLFGSPTTVGTAVQLAAVPDIPRSKSSDMQSIINNLFRGLLGDAPVDMDTADVLTAAAQTAANVAAAKAAVAALEAKAAAGSFSGVAQAVDFAAYADGALPSSVFEVNANVWTGSPAGSGQFRIRSGRAAYVTTGLDNRRSIAVHKTPTATAWQKVTAVLATQSASYQSTTSAVYLGALLNSTGTTGIYARLSGGSPVQLVDGSGSVLWTASIAAAFSGTYTLEVGVGASENRVRVFWEGLPIIDQTFGSLPSGGRYTAIGVEARSYSRGGGSYTALPGEIAAMTFCDNKPAETLGSHFLVRRTNTAVQSISATAAALVPGGFFAGPELRTADLTWDDATNKLTVTVTGTYLVTVALKREAFTDTQLSAAAAVFVNGALHSIGHRQSGIYINTGGVAVGNRGAVTVTVPVYLQKDDYIQPGYASSNSSGLTGSAFCETYMSVAFIGNTKPVQPVAA